MKPSLDLPPRDLAADTQDGEAKRICRDAIDGKVGEQTSRWLLVQLMERSKMVPVAVGQHPVMWRQTEQRRADISRLITEHLTSLITAENPNANSNLDLTLGAIGSFNGWVKKLAWHLVPSKMRSLVRADRRNGYPVSVMPEPPFEAELSHNDRIRVVADRMEEARSAARVEHDCIADKVAALCHLLETPIPRRPHNIARFRLQRAAENHPDPGSMVLDAVTTQSRRVTGQAVRPTDAQPELLAAFASWGAGDCDELLCSGKEVRSAACELLFQFLCGDLPRPSRQTARQLVQASSQAVASVTGKADGGSSVKALAWRWIDTQCPPQSSNDFTDLRPDRAEEHAEARRKWNEELAAAAHSADISPQLLEELLNVCAAEGDVFSNKFS